MPNSGGTRRFETKVYPCTDDDIRNRNRLETENVRLNKLLLEKPPAESIVSLQTGIIIIGAVAVASFIVGGYLGTKL